VPRDAIAGHGFPVELGISGRARNLRVLGLFPTLDWRRADAPVRGAVRARAERRGVFSAARIELRSASPFGFVSWRRVDELPLARPLEVAPAPAERSGDLGGAAVGEGIAGGRVAPAHGELTRGVRPYARGDARRLVHNPASARWGTTMVRELEVPPGPRLVLVVDLQAAPELGRTVDPDELDAARERAASEALGIALEALRAGRPVVLATAEVTGPVLAGVASEVAAGRRLARAVVGPPARPGAAPGDEVVRVTPVPARAAR
jgi:uncharacterized protein (DUF58 family)